MAKKREGKHDEVMLIPFLDILCSLIGVLVLIIVVVCVAQTQKVQGRTKEDLALAQRHQSLLAQQREAEKAAAALKTKVAEAEKRLLEQSAKGQKLQQDLLARQQKLVELRRRLALAADAERANKDKAAQVQKAIESLLAQIESIGKSIPPIEADIASLKKQLADRQKKPDGKPPPVLVRPSGSGSRQNQRLFFVEAAGSGIVIHKSRTEQVRVAQASVGVDAAYNDFLKQVKESGNASLVFLIRKDGWWTYLRAAGWAEQGFELNTGKLPIPGEGAVDLSLFQGT